MHSRNFDVIVVREARAVWWEHGLLDLSVWVSSFLGNSQASWYSHFADEDIEAQRGEMTGPRPHSQ